VTTLDHVVWAVPSITATADFLRTGCGLATLPGGRHPAWGTRNAIVPLGGAYVELVEVEDPARAILGFGGAVRDAARDGGRLILWCVATPDIGDEADALGLDVVPGVRENPDGTVISWRVAGLPEALAHPDRPFLIQWDAPRAAPGTLIAAHPHAPVRTLSLMLAGPQDHDAVPLDDGVLVAMRAGAPRGPASLRIATARGEVVLPPAAPRPRGG
jgi:hypothetical protein